MTIGRFLDGLARMLSFPESLPIWTPQVDAFLARRFTAAAIHPSICRFPCPGDAIRSPGRRLGSALRR